MRQIDTELLIGGVADGRRQSVVPQVEHLVVSANPPARVRRRASPPANPGKDNHQHYRRERIAGETVVFAFWRVEHMPFDEALKRLFEGYQGSSNHG